MSFLFSIIEKENSRLECCVVSFEVCDFEENVFVDLFIVFFIFILLVLLEDILR